LPLYKSIIDPMVVLGYLASASSRIRLGTAVYILPLRNPFFAARAVATLDVLSGGRTIFGVGVGWLEEEFVLGEADFRRRGLRTEECIQVLKCLWSQDQAEWHGRFYDFGPVKIEPKPVQKPHPPIVFGGETEVALRRAAELGDGWYGMGHTSESAAQQVEKLRTLRRAAGREAKPFEITVGAGAWPAADTWLDTNDVDGYRAAGVDRLIVAPWSGRGEAIRGLERFAREVMAKSTE
jgi:probable F420-dependent oxidoreductase